MTPREITEADLDYWSELNPRPAFMTALGEVDRGIEPCPAILTDNHHDGETGTVVRVAWTLDEIELAHLAKGGTLWLSTWGALPIHSLEVQAPT